MSVGKHEDPVDGLKETQHPDSFDLDVLQARSRNEDAYLITVVKDHKEFLDRNSICSLWISILHPDANSVGEA